MIFVYLDESDRLPLRASAAWNKTVLVILNCEHRAVGRSLQSLVRSFASMNDGWLKCSLDHEGSGESKRTKRIEDTNNEWVPSRAWCRPGGEKPCRQAQADNGDNGYQ